MNRYQLFTSDGRKFWVDSNCVDRAIEKVMALANSSVSCWFLGGTPRSNETIYTA